MTEQSHYITPHLTEQANKLKILLQRDDERRRKEFIRNLAEKRSDGEYPPMEALSPLATNQISVENQLQEQVNFYEDALAKLQKRSEEIYVENKRLYETMNKSVVVEDDSYSPDKFSASRPKERLLRTKGEVERTVMSDSFEEPGQIVTPKNPKEALNRTELYDLEDFSYASEPGQVGGFPSHDTYYQDSAQARRVTFSKDNSCLHERNFDSTSAKPTSSLQCSTKEILPNELDSFQPSPMVNQSNLHDEMKIMQDMYKEILPNELDSFQPSPMVNHSNLHDEMKRMQDVYETKAQHLEVLLNSSRKQVGEQQTQLADLKGELRMYKTPVKEGSVDVTNLKPGVFKPSEKNLVQELLQEREELLEAIKRQQTIVAEGNRHETEAYYHVKKSCEMVAQVQLEKQEAIVRTKQLEKDVDDYKEKYQNLQKSHQEEVASVGKKIRQEFEMVIEELNKKVEEQAVSLSVMDNHLEKSVREKMDLKSELNKVEQHSANQQSTSTAMIEVSQKEVMEALKRQTLAEHDVGQIRLEAKLQEKRKQQEVDQLLLEVKELKRRLHVTEESLNISQKNQLDLANQLNTCKQQMQQEISHRKMLIGTYEDERKRYENDSNQREKELTEIIHETNKCHQLAKEELTRMLDSQTLIVGRYQNECKELAEKILSEQRQHQLSSAQLTDKCQQLENNLKEVLDKEEKNEVLLESYKQQIGSTEHELKEKKELVMMLMSKQSAILRDRYLLSKEIELLKSQLPTTLTSRES